MQPVAKESPPTRARARTILRWVLGVIFLLAGLGKGVYPGNFYSDLLAYEIAFPDLFLRCVAIVLPWLEVLCGAALLADIWVETVCFLVAAMCLSFVLMLGQAVLRGLDLNCGCFGAVGAGWFERPIVALVRASALFLSASWLWLQKSAVHADEAGPPASST